MATYRFYRAVKSGPSVYKQRGGFQPRVQIELAQIRNMMENAFKGTKHAVTIPRGAEVMYTAYQTSSKWKPIDICREIKREKSTSTCHISTDLNEECGGYASGNNVFVIEYDDLYVNGVLNNQNASDLNPRIQPKLISNAKNIADATVLAFAAGGNEVSFLTPVPLANIVEYHAPDVTGWTRCNWD